MARFCPDCGTPRVGDAPTCASCAHVFAEAPEKPEVAADPPQSPEAASAPEPEPPAATSPAPDAPPPSDPQPQQDDSGAASGSPATAGRLLRRPRIIAAAIAALLLVGLTLWWTGMLPRWLGGGSDSGAARIDTSLMPIAFGERCGFVDAQGQMVINPQFESAQFFLADSGLAPVQMGGKWGLIDREGRFAVNPQFDGLNAIAGTQLFVAYLGGRAGIIDAHGAYVVNPQFEGISQFNADGQTIASTGGRWGVIDLRGNFVIPPQFELISWPVAYEVEAGASTELLPAQSGGRWGYIDRRGAWVVNPQFASAGYFDSSGLAAVQISPAAAVAVPGQPPAQGLWGYIDRTGRLVIQPQFGAAGRFTGPGLAQVQMGGQFGYIDRTGAFKINPQFASAESFTRTPAGWRAVVLIRAGANPQGLESWRSGLIDETGAYAINPQFDGLSTFDRNGRAIVNVGNVAGLIDATGRFVVNPVYERLYLMPGSDAYFYAKPLGAAGNQGTYEQGWIDSDGRVLSVARGGICGGDEGE